GLSVRKPVGALPSPESPGRRIPSATRRAPRRPDCPQEVPVMTEQREPRDSGGLTRALGAVTRRMLGGNHQDVEHEHGRPVGRSAIVDCGLYVDGVRRPGTTRYPEALAAARRRADSFVWLGLHE